MKFVIISKLLFAFIFVIGLIIAIAYIFSKLKNKFFFKTILQNNPHIHIVEIKSIDSKQKLIITKIRNLQYFVLLSPNGNLLLDKVECDQNLS